MLPLVKPETKVELKHLKKIAKFAAKHGKLAINQETEIVRGFESHNYFWYVYEKEVENGKFTIVGQVMPENVHLLE